MTPEGTWDLVIPQLPSDLSTTGHVMSGSQENLVGVGPMCDSEFTFTL